MLVDADLLFRIWKQKAEKQTKENIKDPVGKYLYNEFQDYTTNGHRGDKILWRYQN